MQLQRPLTQAQIDAVLELWPHFENFNRDPRSEPLIAEILAISVAPAQPQPPKTQQPEYPPLRVGMHLRYRWTEMNAIQRFGEEHTGRVAKLGRKWIRLINDNAAIRAIWRFDEIEGVNIVGEVTT